MAPAAFWRAWSVWVVSVAMSATGLAYTVVHPLPAKLADFGVTGLNNAVGIVFIGACQLVRSSLASGR